MLIFNARDTSSENSEKVVICSGMAYNSFFSLKFKKNIILLENLNARIEDKVLESICWRYRVEYKNDWFMWHS